MHIIRFTDIEESRWINGGGGVKVIAEGVMGQDGDLNFESGNDWDWRLSIADVGQPGAFSVLADVKRVLTVVDGGPLQLTIDGEHRFVSAHQPLAFDGSSITTAALPGGPVRNLNIMCRVGRTEGSVSVIQLGEQRILACQAAVLLAGHARVEDRVLNRFDTVFGSEAAAATVLLGKGTIALVEFRHTEAV
jgi:uncharacterized protein